MSRTRALQALLGGAIMVAIVLAFVALPQAPLYAPPADLQPANQTQILANDSLIDREGYLPEPGGELEDENELLLSMGDYFYHRVAYPTGQFNSNWYMEAADQDRQVERAVPGGKVVYDPDSTRSPLVLDPYSFTSLGPQPMQSNGCINCFYYGLVTGRVNTMAVDPVTPNVAYLGVDGGGVWKTTNCCSTDTIWQSVTDDPAITTIAIGDIFIDPNDHNVVYAGTGDLRYGSYSFGSAGVLKSTDQGETWTVLGADVFSSWYPQPAGEFPQYQAIGKVRVDPRNSNNVVVGTKTGVFFSYDAGENWTGPCVTNSYADQRQDVTGLILRDTGTSTRIYAFVGARGFNTPVQANLDQNGANGVYRTTLPANGCPASWELISRPDNGWPVGTGSGLPIASPGGNILGRMDVAMAPSNNDVIYVQVQAITPNRGGQLGVWRTTDGGETWEQRSTVTGLTGCYGDYPQNWYDQGVAVDPNNPDVVYIDTVDIFRSTNGGTTFVDLTCGYAGGHDVHVDHHALAYVPGSSTTLIAGSDGGAYVTNNANDPNPTFNEINNGLSTLEFYSGDITGNFANSLEPGINGGTQDNGSAVYVWTEDPPGPAVWQLRKGGDGMFARIDAVLGQRWYQESQNGNLAVSTTGPYGPQYAATGGWTADRRGFIFPYEIQKNGCPPTGCEHMIAGSYRVYESINGAVAATPTDRWYVNSPDLTKGTLADRSIINQLNYAWSDVTRAIVGTNDGNVQMGFDLGQGVTNSATWVNVTGGNAVLPNRPVLDVALDPVNPLVGYAAVGGFDQNTPATPGHVFQVTCTANCASFNWLDKSGNLPNVPVDSIIANPNFPQQVFAGTDIGLFFTDDIFAATPVWYRFQSGLPNVMIWDMTIDGGATTLALWTRGRGAYVWPLPQGPVNTCPDFNGSGAVDVTDIAAVASHWDATYGSPGWNGRYDRNLDGRITIVDIMMVAGLFGDSC